MKANLPTEQKPKFHAIMLHTASEPYGQKVCENRRVARRPSRVPRVAPATTPTPPMKRIIFE